LNYLAVAITGFAVLSVPSAKAELRWSNIFANNMVIQRGEPVPVWGQSGPNARIQVTLGTQQVATTASADGNWQTALEPLTVGGPYTVTAAAGGETATLTNVLCGDVWLCSGQSNMQLPVQEVEPAESKLVLSERPSLRLCTVAKTPSEKPLTSTDIQWRVCSAEAAEKFSAVAYFFASELLKDPALTSVPIGLVDSSFGGTTCEGWIPQPALAAFAPKDLHDSMFGIRPANLYNAMIAPLGRTKFKGVLWYQGESNSAHPETYPALLGTMASEWRKQFGQPSLPFFIVQLPDYANLWEGYYWPWIREAQARAAESIPNSSLIVALGTTDGFNLHPKEKLEIGRRAALLARKVAYGEDLVARGPIFKEAKVEGSFIRVTFDTAGEALANATTGGVNGFALAGANGEYRFATAKIEGNSVIVRSDDVPEPRTVRYAWSASPCATLANKSGLPAAPFRTDALPCENVEIQRKQFTHRVATANYEVTIDSSGMPMSLLFHGAQFLSNEPGAAGGASIPGFWGPRALPGIREIGPRLLSCSDEDVTLQLVFDETSQQWTVQNHGKDPIAFQLALSPLVQTPNPLTDGKIVINRGTNSLIIEGFDGLTNTPTGALLRCQIKAGAARKITLK
jgi:sialate O-acetylesterase